jgi:hypothetical protein
MRRSKLTPADIVILAGGAAMLVGSFLAFYQQTFTALDGSSVSFSVNSWDRGLFMIATLPALLGMFMALQVGLRAFSNIDMPNRVLSLTWDQFHLAVSFQVTLLMVAFFVAAKPLDFGIGFWVMLLAAIAMFVAAITRIVASNRRPRLL